MDNIFVWWTMEKPSCLQRKQPKMKCKQPGILNLRLDRYARAPTFGGVSIQIFGRYNFCIRESFVKQMPPISKENPQADRCIEFSLDFLWQLAMKMRQSKLYFIFNFYRDIINILLRTIFVDPIFAWPYKCIHTCRSCSKHTWKICIGAHSKCKCHDRRDWQSIKFVKIQLHIKSMFIFFFVFKLC